MTRLTERQIEAYRALILTTKEQEPMAHHTSFRIGGPARLFVIASSSEVLLQAVQAAQQVNIPWYVFGGGTNLLVADEGFEGVMIQAANRGFSVQSDRAFVESGMITVLAARKIHDAGLVGFEWAVGLPGTIGGAVYGNAGCFGGEMKDAIATVDAMRVADGQRVSLSHEQCRFGYRQSFFKEEPHVILGCELKLSQADDLAAARVRMSEILASRKSDQPVGSLSAGCVFKNARVDRTTVETLIQRGLNPRFGHDSQDHLAAGWLIEQAGMKGRRVGDVQVSEKHGNFLLTGPRANAQDVRALIEQVKQAVSEKFGVDLHEEVQYAGF